MAIDIEATEAEAARRYPLWDTDSLDQGRHRAGYWAFIAGAGWALNGEREEPNS